MRSKRRCVLEKKQPYSGDEWCSGPDTEEDEDKPHTAAHRESAHLDTGETRCRWLLSECGSSVTVATTVKPHEAHVEVNV